MNNAQINFTSFGKCKVSGSWYLQQNTTVNRLYIIHDGEGCCIRDSVVSPLKKGYIYLFFSGKDIEFISNDENPIVHTYFDFTALPAFNGNHDITIKISDNDTVSHLVKSIDAFFSECKCYRDSSESDKDSAAAYLKLMLTLINRKQALRIISDKRINAAINHIHRNFGGSLSVEAIAAKLYLEKNYFIKLFKKNTGITVYQYIKDYRLNIANGMLKNGESVENTAYNCGFESAVGFSNAYKAYFGERPSETKKG